MQKFELSSVPESSEGGAIRLEKLKFEPFSGELRKYPRFKEEFLKHVKPRYKPHEEAFVLKSYLATDIKEDVDNLGDDATEIWRRLDRKYNDKSQMVALRKTAEMSKDEATRACETVISNSYMDDIMDSVDLLEEAEKGGFKIKEWVHSGGTQDCGTDVDEDGQRAVQLFSGSGVAPSYTERVLGMGWDPESDALAYKVKLNFSTKRRKVHSEANLSREQIPENIPSPLTKRQVLSQVNGVYDPMGLMSPFTV